MSYCYAARNGLSFEENEELLNIQLIEQKKMLKDSRSAEVLDKLHHDNAIAQSVAKNLQSCSSDDNRVLMLENLLGIKTNSTYHEHLSKHPNELKAYMNLLRYRFMAELIK